MPALARARNTALPTGPLTACIEAPPQALWTTRLETRPQREGTRLATRVRRANATRIYSRHATRHARRYPAQGHAWIAARTTHARRGAHVECHAMHSAARARPERVANARHAQPTRARHVWHRACKLRAQRADCAWTARAARVGHRHTDQNGVTRMALTTSPLAAITSVVPTPYHAIVFANGKGGVGKTSLASNEAALFGNAGYRVLLIELDMQGNCARDFGLPVGEWETVEDLIASNGEAHAAALMLPGAPSAPPPFYKDVRPGVDLIAGGHALERIYKYFASNAATQGLHTALIQEIVGLNKTYDLILIDAPPIDMTAMDAVLRVAGTVIIPIRADDGSIDGLSVVARRFEAAREDNPALRLGGVVRFGLGSSSTRIAERVQKTVDEILGGTAPVFKSIIRHSDAATFDGRRHGLMAYELESASKIAQQDRLKRLRAGALQAGTKPADDGGVSTGAESSRGLAEDYESLAAEIVERINELANDHELAEQYAEA